MARNAKAGIEVETVVFNGRTYRRYPASKRSVHRRYFSGAAKLLHRVVWEFHNGEIPFGWHVHHKNGDTTDNRIENLECMPASDHFAEHKADHSESGLRNVRSGHMDRIRHKASEWHRSEAGRAWHREHACRSIHKPGHERPPARVIGTGTCQWCGVEFEARSKRKVLCSTKCQLQLSAYRRGKQRFVHPHYQANHPITFP